ncbi:hypothetical protein [Infirmifilum sp.]|uniref:hypothetical protein n=1 Tax=Infirmifilum sp. TaxID=2856575 RepID=UPI003D102BCC
MSKVVESLIRAVCGESENCRETMQGIYKYIIRLEELIISSPKPVLNRFEPPLIKNVENIEEIKKALPEDVASDKALLDYTLSRLLVNEFSQKIEAANLSCPICGNYPTLILLDKKPTLSFEVVEARSRCICGYERVHERFMCPRCGSKGREVFESYVTRRGEVKVFRCKKCGHIFGEVDRDGLSDKEIQGLHFALRLAFRDLEKSEGGVENPD